GTGSADVRGLKWKVLPAMAAEGVEAAQHLAEGPYGKVQSYSGDAALEEHFKRLVHPRLVVLVTHGFFLPDQPADRAELFDDDPTTRSAFAQGKGLARLRAQENPLYRSGVVLAGANTLDDPAPDGVSVEDGWLTAEEISQLDLRGTDLVVLSACNTGRGAVATGDAVAGLRSAFLFAGTQTLIGSLYEVPDRETLQLMQSFYAGLRQRKGKLPSLNAARLKLIDRLRAEGGAAHPFFWASFVLVGQP
ncbi:MAG: CHAT domain-containing protein, partial [Pirellulales bacterium]|nr:CHAT domain-containing protein [Pirellulales bacterium]